MDLSVQLWSSQYEEEALSMYIIYKFASIFGDSDVPVGVVTTKKWALIQAQQTFHQDYHL